MYALFLGAYRRRLFVLSGLMLSLAVGTAVAQEEEDEALEEIIVTGSQIRGANIRDALAVSVVTSQDIEELGIDSGAELLEYMSEQGQNFFAEAESISGGVNGARGDIGAFNLRNLGTGNTLVLLNGRRLVNAASYQTESVGGSFVPVNTVNAQSLPIMGLERVEVLRDGASAIYGADAVAGVVNYVMKTDFDGFAIRAKYGTWEGLSRDDVTVTFEWGHNFNGGSTNLSVFGSYYDRGRVPASEDPRWAESDHRPLIPETSVFAGNSRFNRGSTNSEHGEFDAYESVSGYNVDGILSSSGQFNTYPVDSEFCDWDLNENACGAVDGNPRYPHNLNENRDVFGDLQRTNFLAFLTHEFANGIESFSEFSLYTSDTNTNRHRSTRLSAVEQYRLGAENYYNPFGPCGSPNRLPFELIGDDTNGGVPCAGIAFEIENYGWVEAPRIVNNDGETYRILTGLRGQAGAWDWEGAISWSRAEKEDITSNRISNTIIQQLLDDPTPAAYNPFNGGIDTNIEPALIDVRRDNETELTTIDFRLSRPDVFELPAGPVGVLAGVEYREASFVDDRDPRLDGTITFTDNEGKTFPFVSDVMNSSPTADSEGERDVTSVFAELQVPVLSNLDAQLAMRYEDFSDVGDTTVGKVALGWRPVEQLLFRGSWSEAYRVPNLVTVNETGVARSNATDDFVCFFADPDQEVLDCNYGVQRTAAGSQDLVPEESTNTSIGVVWDIGDWLTFTLDFWRIKKEKTIGLFGEDNWTALDLLIRLEQGAGNCASAVGATQVVREDPSTLEPEEAQVYLDAGICPVGPAQRVDDSYANLDTREIRGHDFGVYFNRDTRIGTFDVRYNIAFLDDYNQLASGPAQTLLDAKEAGTLPEDVPVVGFASLIRQDGNPRRKQTARIRWMNGDWGAALTARSTSDVVDTRPGVVDGQKWITGSMTTWNGSVDYRFRTFGETDARVRFGVNNLFDERAPLDSEYFGYESDVYSDLPRSFYLDVRLDF